MTELQACIQGMQILSAYDQGDAYVTGHSDVVHVCLGLSGVELQSDHKEQLFALGWTVEGDSDGDDEWCYNA